MSQIIIGREYPEIITNLVKNAKSYIKVLMYDWRWYNGEVGSKIQLFNNEIIRAQKRGVDVLSIVNNDFISSQLKEQGVDIKKSDLKNTLHVKMVIIDGKYLVIGSHNLTKNAFEINHEISVLIDDPVSIARCEKFFDNVKN